MKNVADPAALPPGRPGGVPAPCESCGVQVTPPVRSGNPPGAAPQWDSATLLGGQRSTTIVHRGEAYRLQLTRQGKLILTK